MSNSGQRLNNALDELAGRMPGYSNAVSTKGLDLRHGGFHGILPNVAVVKDGVVYGGHISNTPQTSGIVHAFLLDYPKVFDMCGSENAEVLISKLSRFISYHVEVIDGINDQINWDYSDDVKVGRAGESLHEPTNATIVPTEITLGWTEKLGFDIRNLITFIGRYAVMDPYTGYNLASLLPGFERTSWTLDMRSFAIMAYELDATGTTVINAQIIANMMARTNGEWMLKKDPSSGREVKKYNIGFTGFGIRGVEVIQVAQKYWDGVQKESKDALLTTSLYQDPVAEVSPNAIEGTLYDKQNQ